MEEKIFRNAVEELRQIINDPKTLEKFRKNERDFTRDRNFAFTDYLNFEIAGYNSSLTADLRRYYQQTRENVLFQKAKPITVQSYSIGRKKIKDEVFKYLFEVERSEYVDNHLYHYLATDNHYYHPIYWTFSNDISVAVDGSAIALPNDPELLKQFGGTGAKAHSPTARMSIACHTLDFHILDAVLVPLAVDERTLLKHHIDVLVNELHLPPEEILIITDAGYPSREILEFCEEMGIHYLMRVGRAFSKKVNDAPMSSSVVELNEDLSVRVVKFLLDSHDETRKVEQLITNISACDDEDLYYLYSSRWRAEIDIKHLKSTFHLELFDSRLSSGIQQDFFARILKANLAYDVFTSANTEIRKVREGQDNKYLYQSNISEISRLLTENLATLLATKNKTKKEQCFNNIENGAQHSIEPIRLDRQIIRKKNNRLVRWHHNHRI